MNDLTKIEKTAIQAAPDRTFELLHQAVQQGATPESLEKLLDLQERVLARQAEREYADAIAQFQSRCPTIEKRKEVKDRSGRVMYRYAPLEDIVRQVRPLLAELGLSYAFDTECDEKGGIRVRCKIRHRAGHAETSTVYIPATRGINTNASQDMGIQITYGTRYSFIGGLGITTADEDHDAVVEQCKPITAEQALDLQAMADEVGADRSNFLKYLRVDSFESIPASAHARAVAALEAKRRRQ